jgi:hypothetical protein
MVKTRTKVNEENVNEKLVEEFNHSFKYQTSNYYLSRYKVEIIGTLSLIGMILFILLLRSL